MNIKSIANFIFELGQLKRIKHEGWRIIGVDNPETVAAHCLRAAQIGYILAVMEEYENPYEVVTAVTFKDIGECRLGDIHRTASRYIKNVKKFEEKAITEQLTEVSFMKDDIYRLWNETDFRTTKMGNIAKDANMLEMAFTAQELVDQGNVGALQWRDNFKTVLKTKSALELFEELRVVGSNINNL
ncbi:MAG: HD domain-containing protein [Candidatus Roizmanbacteria bacterium]|nr:HD domain-containing protein [Candidatus Roizmanbacteria bacterium]